MFDTSQSVIDFLRGVLGDENLIDYAGQYGEPGYSLREDTGFVVLGSYWCRCSKFAEPGDLSPLHDIAAHYPHAFARLEELGVVFEWHDEWLVDSENDKAYRTSPDSYSWMPSFVWTDDGILTADDDIDVFIDWAANETSRCIPSNIYSGSDVEAAGFEKFNGTFESGWHPHQTDTPEDVDARIRAEHGDDVTVVFALDSTGQFDIAFSAYFKREEADTDD